MIEIYISKVITVRGAGLMNEERIVIKVYDNELSVKRAQKEALKAKRKGIPVAFDLSEIKGREAKMDVITYLNA